MITPLRRGPTPCFPGEGISDTVTIYSMTEDGAPAFLVIRRMYGVFQDQLFTDPCPVGFYSLRVARQWIRQTFPLCHERIKRHPSDSENVIETWQ